VLRARSGSNPHGGFRRLPETVDYTLGLEAPGPQGLGASWAKESFSTHPGFLCKNVTLPVTQFLWRSRQSRRKRGALRGYTPLSGAASHGREDIVPLLIDNRANVNAADLDGGLCTGRG
jgi:Ankyrin repeat